MKHLFFIFLFLLNFNIYADVNSGDIITSGLFNSILTRLGIIEEKHPMGYHKDNGCRPGFSFVKLTNIDYGYCAKLLKATDGYTSVGNFMRCGNLKGKAASIIEIQSMIVYDLETFKTMANHTSGWKWYMDGDNIMARAGQGEWGPYGSMVNPTQPCGVTSTGSCYTGDGHWDVADKIDDVNNAGLIICVY